MQTKHLSHRHDFGSQIIAIHSVGHVTEKGVAWWFFRGDVKWSDGKVSHDLEMGPRVVCYDADVPESKPEWDSVNEALDHYLRTAGRWHDQKSKGDLVYSWTPKKKEGNRAIEDMIAECQKEAA